MESFQDRIIKALRARIGDAICPMCRRSDWAVQDGVFRFKVHIKTEHGESWGDALPSAALVCNICGNTQFINLLLFGDMFKGYI